MMESIMFDTIMRCYSWEWFFISFDDNCCNFMFKAFYTDDIFYYKNSQDYRRAVKMSDLVFIIFPS